MIFILVLIILSLDQLTKFIVTKNLYLNQSLPVVKGVFHISLIHNRGAAFGILKNQAPVFIVTAIAAIILICLGLSKNSHRPEGRGLPSDRQSHRPEGRGLPSDRQSHKKIYSISLGLILAGASGNLIDRLFFGYVIDFLDFRIWPVFNIADSAITIGAVLLGWNILNPPRAN